jgi:hypothetical protein
MSFGMMVTRLAWMAQRLVSSKSPTRYASADGRLLERENGVALEAEVRLEVLGDLPHEALEGKLADQEVRALLVLADLPERDGAGPVAVGLLHAAGGRGRLPRLKLKPAKVNHRRNRHGMQ